MALRTALLVLAVGLPVAAAFGPRKSQDALEDLRQAAEVAALVRQAAEAARPTLRREGVAAVLPKFPTRFVVEALVTTLTNGKPGVGSKNASKVQISQESDNKRRAEAISNPFPVAPAPWVGTPLELFNETTYFAPAFIGLDFNGARLPTLAPNVSSMWDFFSWLPAAVSCGQLSYKGQLCDCWGYKFKSADLTVSFLLLLDGSENPVLMEQNTTRGAVEQDTRYQFLQFLPNATLPWLWDNFDPASFSHPPVCQSQAVRNVTMYIFHPKNQFDIAGQDLADLVGDTLFVCLDLITNQSSSTDHDYAWLSQYEIELLPAWGQYQNCNGYPPACLSAETFRVGHEAAYYLGRAAAERQCGRNPMVGEWYSLPPAGQCQGSARPGDGSCTWRIVRKVKTIDGQCLFGGGSFRESCIREGRAPFHKTAEVLVQAFVSNRPATGGCPPIDVEVDENTLVV